MEKYRKAREELLVMVFCALLCVCLFTLIIPLYIPVPPAAEKDVFTPRTFPYFLSVVISICTAIGLGRTSIAFAFARRAMVRKEAGGKKTGRAIVTFFIPYIIFAMIVLYGVLIAHFGFVISTLAIPPLVLFLIGGRKWTQYVGVLVFAAAIWTIFRFVLHVQLP